MKMRIIKTVSMLLAICLFATGCLPAMADDLVLPASLKTIGDSAFEGDMSLDEVILQEGVETIGSRAFADTSITHIYLPASLTSIAKDAFDGSPRIAYHAQPGTYAYDWLAGRQSLLSFGDANAYEITVDMAVFEENEEIGLFSDPFVYYFALAEPETWSERLGSEPVWTAIQTAGPATDFWIEGGNPYERSLNVAMPEAPLTAEYEIRCEWDGQVVTSHTTVRYVYPNVMPSGLNIPDLIQLVPEEENVIGLAFEPSFFRFGENRIGLENCADAVEHWYDGSNLHLIPHEEGTFSASVYLYAGNMYIGKPIVFRVADAGSSLDPAVEASGLDWYTLTWNPQEGVTSCTVSAWLDETCTELFRTLETEDSYLYFNTDVGTRYWFTVEYEVDGEIVRSQPITADPVTPLPAPENLTAAVREDGTVQLSWDPVGDIWGYRIYTSSRPEWTVDTEWFSFEGGPGYDGLWVDVGETLYVWVCADNYDGPNERAMITVQREYALTDEVLLSLAEDEDFDFYLSDSVLENLTAQGADPADVEALRVAITNYNTALDDLVAFVDETYADIDISLDDNGTLVYTSPRTTFAVSSEALDLIASSHDAGEWVSSSGNSARLEVFVDGQTYYLEQNAASLCVVSPDTFARRSLADEDPLAPILAEYDAMESSNITLEQLWDNYGVAADIANIAATGLTEAGYDLGGFNTTTGIAAGAKDLANIPIQRQRLINAHTMLLKLNEIATHTHPTEQELMSTDSMEIIESMSHKLNAARWALASEMLNNWYGMYLGSASVVSNFVKKKVVVGQYDETLSKLNAFFASRCINSRWMNDQYAKAHELYQDVLDLDSQLHYDVWGIVTDKQGNRLEGVRIEVDNPRGDEITTVTDDKGYYAIEVPYQTSGLNFSKEGYFPVPETVTASSSPLESTQRNVAMKRTAWNRVTGTVKDEYGAVVYNALICAGEYNSANDTWEYTAYSQSDGSYILNLPVREQAYDITVKKAGYHDAYRTVTVFAEHPDSWDPVLSWSYGVKGTVMSDQGPVGFAAVKIYRYQGGILYTAIADEYGFYRCHVMPGSYSLLFQGGIKSYVNTDLYHEDYSAENFTVEDNQVKVMDIDVISTKDRYRRFVDIWISQNNSVSVKILSCTYSWGSSSAHAVPTPGYSESRCICVSDDQNVTIQVIVTYEVDGVTYSKTRTASVDLTAKYGEDHSDEGYYVDRNNTVIIPTGWWNEP